MDSEKTAPSHRVIRYLLDRRRPGSQKSRIGNEILKKLTSGSVPGASRDPPDTSRSHLESLSFREASRERLWDLKIHSQYREPEKIQTPYRDPDRTDHAHRVIEPNESKPHTEIPKNESFSQSVSRRKTIDPETTRSRAGSSRTVPGR